MKSKLYVVLNDFALTTACYCSAFQVVAPKKEKLKGAEAELAVQMEKLNAKRAQLKEVRTAFLCCVLHNHNNTP